MIDGGQGEEVLNSGIFGDERGWPAMPRTNLPVGVINPAIDVT
ncbi:hypothetical protein [Oricola sp.]|nr:hypothetical protein [Oricola sp.]